MFSFLSLGGFSDSTLEKEKPLIVGKDRWKYDEAYCCLRLIQFVCGGERNIDIQPTVELSGKVSVKT
ncbi:hypothetical protein H6P81_003236 [Aristolochia fimbriata]|uniref:Uncharacterized protein n=1 Tax=Aristolochia fimbriata TaxID=158543 RepID=A0AAV7FCS2_ARIFI|nr:hypothetical protein H6P81_003236 [Aristolochia fimbriata]